MRKSILFCWLLVVTSLPAFVQQTSPVNVGESALPSDAPSREQVLKALFEPGKNRREHMRSIFDTLKQQLGERARREGTSADKIKFMEDVLDAALNGVSADELDAIDNAMVRVYQRHFTSADLDAIAAFNTSSAGQKLRNGQKELITHMMQAMDPAQVMVLATKPLPADAPSREQLLKLFDAMQMRKNAALMIGAFKEQSNVAAAKSLKSHGMDPGAADKSTYNPDTDPSLDRTLNAMMVAYQRFFTASEVEAMITFNLSATGQKFLAATPEIAAESAKAMAPMQRRVMEAVFLKIKEYDEQQKNKSGLIHPNRTFPVK